MNKLLTKIVGAALGLTMTVGVGVAVASSRQDAVPAFADNVITNTITFGGGASNSGYTGTFTESDSASKSWTIGNFNNNSWGWNSSVSGANKTIKCGRKNNASVAYIQNFAALPETTFTKVDLYITALTSGKLNSLKVYGDSTSGGTTNELASVTSITASTSNPTSLTLTNTSAYSYYRIAFDMASGSGNGLLSLDKVCWYQDNGSTTTPLDDPSPVYDSANDKVTWTVDAHATKYQVKVGNGEYADAIVSGEYSTSGLASEGIYTVTVKAVGSGTYSDTEGSVTFSKMSHAGTQADPYTVAQARTAIDANYDLSGKYVKGVVASVSYAYSSTNKNITFELSDNGVDNNIIKAYKCAAATDPNVEVGDIITSTGTLLKFNSTYELGEGNTIHSHLKIDSLGIKTAPSDVIYDEGEHFDPTGLVITATYDDNPATTKDFAYADLSSSFSFNPTTSTALTSSDDSIEITLFGKTTTQAITVNARVITGITVTGSMTNTTYVKDAAWDYSGLSLTVAYNSGDPSVIALNTLTAGTDFIVSKATADGTTSLTISGTYEGTTITSRTITGITYTSEVTWAASSLSSNTLVLSQCGLSLTLSSGTLSNGTDYRVYKNATATIASSGENIRKIEFTGTSGGPISGMVLTSGGGALTTEGNDGEWLGNASSIVFTASTAQTRIEQLIITTASGMQPVPVNGLTVDGETATVGQTFNVEIVKNKTYKPNVSVSPTNTTESKAISYERTAGSGATVDSNTGVITAGSSVGGTATIKATSVANSNYYVFFSVTVTDTKTVFVTHFANESTGDSNTAITTETWEENVLGDGLELECTDTSRVYPSTHTMLKFGGSSNAGTLSLKTPSSVEIGRVVLHAKAFSNSGENPAIKVNSGESQVPTANFSYLTFDIETPSDVVTIASATNSKCRFYVDEIVLIGSDNQAASGAYAYAAQFMNALDGECSSESVTTSTWSSLNTAWTTMGNANGEQTFFLSKTPSPRDAEGLTPTGDVIQKALARYDFIIGKYNKTQGLSSYSDFMNRDPDPVGAPRVILTNLYNNNGVIAIVVVISMMTVTAIGMYYFLRKRKEQ